MIGRRAAAGGGRVAGGRVAFACAFGFAVAACTTTGESVTPTVAVEGDTITLDADRALRAVRIDLEWDASLTVTGVEPAADVARMNLFRVAMNDGGTGARVLIADSRKLRLPIRGDLVRVVGTGEGQIRIVDVEAAEDGARTVTVEIAP